MAIFSSLLLMAVVEGSLVPKNDIENSMVD